MAPRSRSAGKTTIKIPTPLYHKIALLIEGSGYNSVTDFIVYVLRDLVGERELEATRLSGEELAETARLGEEAQGEEAPAEAARAGRAGEPPADVKALRATWTRQLERAKRKLKSLGYL